MTETRLVARLCLGAAALLIFRPVLPAQDWATLAVTVADRSGAVVPQASVTLNESSRGTSRQTTTRDDGRATFDALAPGGYFLEVEKAGFNKFRIERLQLNVRDRQTLRVELTVAPAAGTKIDVSAKAEGLSSDATTGISVDQNYIQNLPANGRNAEALILMTPGISTAAGGKGGGGFNSNGMRSNTNYYTLDGVSVNQGVGGGGPGGGGPGGGGPGGGGPGAGGPAGSATDVISIDAMQEMKVQTSAFAPEFGRTPGAQVTMTSRGGSNDLHGTAFYYFRRDAYDANDWFANAAGYPKGKERENRPGGVFGGPLVKNKTFFFVSFEKLKLSSPYTVVAVVPDLASRLSASPALRPFLNAYPIPNGTNFTAGGAEYRAVVSNPSDSSSTSARVDHVLNASTVLFGRYSISPANSDRRGSDNTSPNVINSQTSRSYTTTVGATHVFSAGVIDDLKFNYSKSTSRSHSVTDNFGGAVPLTDALMFPAGITTANGSFDLNILGFAGYSYGGANSGNQQQVNVVDSLSILSGNHHYKLGLDYRRVRQTSNRQYYNESVSFNGISVNDYSFLSGSALNARVSANVGATYPEYTNFSSYAQDTWRATDRTTVTYGLRWDINPAPTSWQGQRPFALSDSTIAGVTQNEPLYPTRWYNIAPRVGVAYLSDDKPGREMTFRLGAGMFYDMGYGVVSGAFNGAPFSNVNTISKAKFPLTTANLIAPVLPPTRPYGQITTGSTDLKSPVVYQFNASLEKNFGAGQTLNIAIVSTRGKKLMRAENEPASSDAYQVLNKTTNGATSDYNALQAQFRRRLSSSLQTQLSYTWAHSIDSSSNDAGFGGGFASLFGSGERGSSDYDVRHNLSFSGSWRLPAPRHGAVWTPLRDWYADFVAAARSGLPFDIQGVSTTTSNCKTTGGTTTCTSTTSAGLFAQVRPSYNGQTLWLTDSIYPGGRRLNPKAFFIPAGYAQGNLARNALRGAYFGQLDLALRRMIPLTERFQMSLAAQGYNVLNHPNFSNISAFEGGNMSSPNFGIATRMMNQGFGGGVGSQYRSGGARSMEFVLRFQF